MCAWTLAVLAHVPSLVENALSEAVPMLETSGKQRF